MKPYASRRALAAIASLALVAVVPLASARPAAAAPIHPQSRLVVMHSVVRPFVRAGAAQVLGARPASAPMALSIDLPFRDAAALNHFIATQVPRGHYLSHATFNHRFGATRAHEALLTRWLHASGLRITYESPDRLTYGVAGSTAAVEQALDVRINRYRFGRETFYAAASNPTVPRSLGIDTIVGLDNYTRFHALNVHRDLVRDGGYYPIDYRIAYDVNGHGVDGSGQNIGLILWGHQAYDSDFAALAANQKNDTGISDPVLKSCGSCSSPDRVQWIHIDGTDNSGGQDLTEVSMDAEFAHGIAVHSHLRFYLAKAGRDDYLADAVKAATSDPKIHVVSNSWGGPNDDPTFTKASKAYFKEAVAVGTTFFFGSGDNSENSGCATTSSGAHTLCNTPAYPGSSPWVVSVGGTNLQVNNNVTWNSESVWNSDPNNDFSGGGSGCASAFSRQSWQKGIVGTAATCKGRAVPDLSADGDPQTGAHVFLGNGQEGTVGGTSLATPLETGMAALTDAYLAKLHKKPAGFLAPIIYRLGKSSLYNTYFHDVRCGFNGYPAGPGWDEASGFGSIDWYRFAKGVAGQSVKRLHPSYPNCTPVGSANQLLDPFDGFLAWPVYAKNEKSSTWSVTKDDSSANPFRQFHASSYQSWGVQGSEYQQATFDIQGDGSYAKSGTLYYLGSYLKNNFEAAALLRQERGAFASFKPVLGGPNCLVNFAFTSAPVDCYFYGLINLANNKVGVIGMIAEQNAVIEVLATTANSNVKDSTLEQNFLNGFSLVLQSGIDQVNSATNSGSGEQYAVPASARSALHGRGLQVPTKH